MVSARAGVELAAPHEVHRRRLGAKLVGDELLEKPAQLLEVGGAEQRRVLGALGGLDEGPEDLDGLVGPPCPGEGVAEGAHRPRARGGNEGLQHGGRGLMLVGLQLLGFRAHRRSRASFSAPPSARRSATASQGTSPSAAGQRGTCSRAPSHRGPEFPNGVTARRCQLGSSASVDRR